MSLAMESCTEPSLEARQVFGLAENRVKDAKQKQQGLKKLPPQREMKRVSPKTAIQPSKSSDSCSSVSSGKKKTRNGVKSRFAKVMPDGAPSSEIKTEMKKHCDWISPFSDPLYSSFHDEEWGAPVHDDQKLFELLVLSEALAELSWPTILKQRDTFRKLFDKFDPASIANFTENNILSLKANGKALLSEHKLRAVVENANQILKVQHEFGSFNNYCWSFVNHKPVKNGYHYVRQVPVKTPKAEAISKDLMRRGFRCVGPTVIYSFMQVAGLVNDHLITCFRYQECGSNIKGDNEAHIEETKLAKSLENTCLSPVLRFQVISSSKQ